MDLQEFFETAFEHIWKLILLACAIFGVLAYFLLTEPKAYEARALVLYKIGREYSFIPDEGDSAIKSPNPGDFQTAVNAEMLMLDDRAVREATLAKIGLERVYPELAGNPDGLRLGAQKLQGATSISLITGSYVIKVAVRHADPVIAAELSNTLVGQYMEKRQEVLIRSETDSLRQRLETAEDQAAQTAARIEMLTGGSDAAVYAADFEAAVAERETLAQSVNAIDSDLAVLAQRAVALEAAFAELEPVIVEHRDFGSNPVFSTLRANLALRQSEYESKARLLGPNHPTVRAIADEMELLERQIADQPDEVALQRRESANPVRNQVQNDLIATRVAIDDQSARRAYHESAMTRNAEAIADQSPVVAELRLQQNKLAQQNARIATLYLRLRESEGFANRDSASQTSARVIQAAEAPVNHAGLPNLVRVVIAAVVSGVLALAALVLAHLLKTTVSSARSVEDQLGVPVLGEIRRRSPRDASGSAAA